MILACLWRQNIAASSSEIRSAHNHVFFKNRSIFFCSFIAAPLFQNVTHFTRKKSGPSENLLLEILNFLLSWPEEPFSFHYLHKVVLRSF